MSISYSKPVLIAIVTFVYVALEAILYHSVKQERSEVEHYLHLVIQQHNQFDYLHFSQQVDQIQNLIPISCYDIKIGDSNKLFIGSGCDESRWFETTSPDGKVIKVFYRLDTFRTQIIFGIVLRIVFLSLSLLAIVFYLAREKRLKLQHELQLAKLAAEGASAAAVARTTQMLAHDVRKPFSMMEALIEIIGDTTDPTEIKKTVQENLPSVSQALNTTDLF